MGAAGSQTMLRSEADNLGAKLFAATLVVVTAHTHVTSDNKSLDTLLVLAKNPSGAAGVQRFVEIMGKHGAEVAKACSDLSKALSDAAAAQASPSDSVLLRSACKSIEKLDSAGELWEQNKEFVREKLQDVDVEFDAETDESLQECRERLAEDAEVCGE